MTFADRLMTLAGEIQCRATKHALDHNEADPAYVIHGVAGYFAQVPGWFEPFVSLPAASRARVEVEDVARAARDALDHSDGCCERTSWLVRGRQWSADTAIGITNAMREGLVGVGSGVAGRPIATVTSLRDRLDDIRLRVCVPVTGIAAELRNRDQVTVTFGPEVYRRQTERRLERSLAGLARLLCTAWLRATAEVLVDSFIRPATDCGYFRAARADLVASGMSINARVTVTAIDMRDIHVGIADGTLETCGEEEFGVSVAEAVTALLTDHMLKVRELKDRYFG